MDKYHKGLGKTKGSLTVEVLLFMIPVMCAFFSLVNISRYVQTEMILHHAITQTAKQISVYSYVLTKTGISEKMQETNKKSAKFKTTTEETIQSVADFYSAVGNVGSGTDIADEVEQLVDAGNNAYDSVTDYFSEPKEILAGALSILKSEVRGRAMTYVAGCIARGCIRESLSYMTADPDKYLESVGVVDGLEGLDFSQSDWIGNADEKANIEIVVTYKMHNLMFPQFDFGEHQYRLCASTSIW